MGNDFTGGKVAGLRFSKQLATLGVLGGLGIALGMPWIILAYGAHLGTAVQTTVIILALLGGGFMALVSAFLGVVIPSKLGAAKGGASDRIIQMALKHKRAKGAEPSDTKPPPDDTTGPAPSNDDTPAK